MLGLLGLIAAATTTVYVGARTSIDDKAMAGGAGDNREIIELSYAQAVAIPLSSSACLLLLFFFFDYVQYILVGLLVISAAFALFQLSVLTILNFCRCFTIGSQATHIIALVFTIFGIADWLLTGNLVWHNLLGCSLCVFFIVTLKFPSLKLAVLCLTLLVVYDIFWVFCSEYFFEKNVMVDVATKVASNPVHDAVKLLHFEAIRFIKPTVELPIKLIFPNYATGRMIMLGLGDIALPGALVSLALRCDMSLLKSSQDASLRKDRFVPGASAVDVEKGHNPAAAQAPVHLSSGCSNSMNSTAAGVSGQSSDLANTGRISADKRIVSGAACSLSTRLFEYSMIGYFVGLVGAFVGNTLSGHPQPALIYLVPSVLLAIVGRAWRLGHLIDVWGGPEKIEQSS